MLLGQKLTEIWSITKNHGSGNGYCAENMSRIIKEDLELGAFKRQRVQRLIVALKENRKKIKKSVVVR